MPTQTGEKLQDRQIEAFGGSMSLVHAYQFLAEHEDKIKTKGRCKLWQGALNSKGYPSVKVDGKAVSGHRHVLELKLKPHLIGKNLQACHKCGNRNCIAPGHLYAGTQAENEADKH